MFPPQAVLFFAKPLVRLGLGLAGLAVVVFFCWRVVTAVQNWQTEAYNKGFSAGSDTQEKRWQTASAENARRQRDQLLLDAKQQNQSVLDYLTDIRDKQPRVVRVKEETIRYAQSAAGRTQCLDDDGVRLVLEGRTALGIGGQANAPPGAPGAVPRVVRSALVPVPVQR